MQGPSEPNCFMQGVLRMDGDEVEAGQAIIFRFPRFSNLITNTYPSIVGAPDQQDYGSQSDVRGCRSR